MNQYKLITHLTFIVLFVCISQSDSKTNNNTFAFYLTQSQVSGSFPFKASDGVFVSTFPDSNSFINRIFPIDDKGFAEFPIVGKVNVSKMSEKQLVDFIKITFKNYLRYPNVYVKPMVRISMLGGFQRPGLYYVDINSSLWDVVYNAGGTILEDGIHKMRWQRNEEDRTNEISKLFESGLSLRAVGFKSGDQVWTPSPGARTVWDAIRDVIPIISFVGTVFVLYNTYRRDTVLLSR